MGFPLLSNSFLSGNELREEDLTFARSKKRFALLRLSYQLKRLFKTLFGARRLLRLCLIAEWIMRRFAFELSCEVFGSRFQESALALSPEELRQWIPTGGTVIDIGCGTGRWCRAVAPYVKHVVGIDYDVSSIEAARLSSQHGNIEYIVGDVTLNELQKRQFDTGLLIHVLEHIDDTDALLQSLRKMVDTLLIEVPDFDSDCLNLIRLELDCPFYSDGDHVREYTFPILQEQLRRTGWTIRQSKHQGGALLVIAGRGASPKVSAERAPGSVSR